MSSFTMREEVDSFGSVPVPAAALYGSNTMRGAENFRLCGPPISAYPAFIRAMAAVKKAAARCNTQLGALEGDIGGAIEAACDEIMAGRHHENFVVALMEGSGGTSTNMNFNEVIANRALQILGEKVGCYDRIHPNDHVNLSQSTNDAFPTAMKLAIYAMSADLSSCLARMQAALMAKAVEFDTVLRVGRTCLQAAQPMTLGQAFGGYATAIARARHMLSARHDALLTVPLGGTAIGTTLGAAPGYSENVCGELAKILGIPVRQSDDLFDGLQNADEIGRYSAELRTCAEVVAKIGADLALLASGPSGIGEIRLPSIQPGSSIMPGKVNPVLPMLVQQVGFAVHGNDAATALAVLQGQLEINHFEPVMARTIFDSLQLMTSAYALFTDKCLRGIVADRERSYANLRSSMAIASVFLKDLGYSAVTAVARRAEAAGVTFIDIAIAEGLLSEAGIRASLQQAARCSDSISQTNVPNREVVQP